MNRPRNTQTDAKTVGNAALTNRAAEDATELTSLVCVSTAGRGPASSEAAPPFPCCLTQAEDPQTASDECTRHLRCATGGYLQPLRSDWEEIEQPPVAAKSSAAQIPQPLARELRLAFRPEFHRDSVPL